MLQFPERFSPSGLEAFSPEPPAAAYSSDGQKPSGPWLHYKAGPLLFHLLLCTQGHGGSSKPVTAGNPTT